LLPAQVNDPLLFSPVLFIIIHLMQASSVKKACEYRLKYKHWTIVIYIIERPVAAVVPGSIHAT
jgi:maltodextrin utilization protein YvdJ